VWQTVIARPVEPASPAEPPAEVQQLAALRQAARDRRDWLAADALRAQIEALGWTIQDTPDGPRFAAL
jgi:cysteinyl-tRNA synthetase